MEFNTKDIHSVSLVASFELEPKDGEYVGVYGGALAVFTDSNGHVWNVQTVNAVKGFGYKILVKVVGGRIVKMVTL